MSALAGARVLVTGGAGFIGSHLVDELLDHHDPVEVRVIDNLATGRMENLERLGSDGRLRFDQADLRDADALERALDGVDVVLHLACLGVRHSLHDPVENHEVNAGATLGLLEAARRHDVRRFVHVSSSEVFGTAQYAPMDERHPTWPETVYGGSKLAGEAYARAAHRTHGMATVVARPFNTFGPRSHFEGDSGEVLPRTIVRALCGLPPLVYGDGTQTRDFMHVSDTVRGLAALASCDAAIGQTVNLGSGREVTINDLAEAVVAGAGRPDLQTVHLEARPGDVRRLIVDGTFMKELTGFETEVVFEDGVRDLVAWFASRPQTPQEMLARIEDRNWVGSPVATAAGEAAR
ncbi:dTDP-glucose 4,6-dehydratase [Cellulomonas soli]|uniref:dTDP-glucose 4,6-dehydratase n=1 Tax=Cellulomonas soli TaxID=931535 RepID=UPI003F8364B7